MVTLAKIIDGLEMVDDVIDCGVKIDFGHESVEML